MKGQMKRFLGLKGWAVLLTGAFVLGSCVEDEVLDNQENLTPKKSISFNAVVDWAEDHIEGRAAELSKANLTSFHVWATLNRPNVSNVPIAYFSGVEFSDPDKLLFASNPAYYWPGIDDVSLDFVAVGGKPATGFTATMTNNRVTSFEYTVPTAAADQTDVIVAIAPGIPGDNTEAVPLTFSHIMSQVNVSIGSNTGLGTINSVTFKNINGKGTCTPPYYAIEANEEVLKPANWTSVNTTSDYSVTFAADNDNTSTTGYTVNSTNKPTTGSTIISNTPFMLLPQTFADGAQIEVSFTPAGSTTAKTLYADLEGSWVMGKAYNYVLNINPSLELDLDIIVVEWTNPGPIYSDYGNTTAVGQDGQINWIKDIDEDSDDDLNYTQTTEGIQKIVKLENTAGKKQAAFTFEIAAPMGGTWYALLETISGNSQAFTLSLLDDNGNQLKNDKGELLPCQGNVGTPGKVMVEVNGSNPFESGTNNKAKLYFVVRLGGGQVLAVPNNELGEYYIQQDFEQRIQ